MKGEAAAQQHHQILDYILKMGDRYGVINTLNQGIQFCFSPRIILTQSFFLSAIQVENRAFLKLIKIHQKSYELNSAQTFFLSAIQVENHVSKLDCRGRKGIFHSLCQWTSNQNFIPWVFVSNITDAVSFETLLSKFFFKKYSIVQY